MTPTTTTEPTSVQHSKPGAAPAVFTEATITPEAIGAGDSAEFIVRLVVGPGYSREATRIVYDFSAMLGTSCPTLEINEASGYVEVYVSNPDVTYTKAIWDVRKGYLVSRDNPATRESSRMLVLNLSAGLVDGDTIEMHWGESTRGFGPGAKVTTVIPRMDFKADIEVRYFEDPEQALPDYGREYEGYSRPVPDCAVKLEYAVLPRELKRLRVIRQAHRALLIPHDAFWNIADIAPSGLGDHVESSSPAKRNEQGVYEYADKGVQLHSKSDVVPLIDHAPMEDVFEGLNIYWGDIHSHSAISIDVATNSRMDLMPADMMRFARDRAGLDYYAVTDHHVPIVGPLNMIQPENWQRILEAAEQYHQPGRFVPFPAFELSNPRGDVVFILKEPLGYEHLDHKWNDVRDTWRSLKGQDYMSIPHFHGPGRLPEGTWWENPDLEHEPVIEIISDHGSYECEFPQEQGRAALKQFRFDRCGQWFLKNGYRYGFVGNGDDHKGHVGVNGITAAFASSLDRDAIFDAYRKRHVYASSNARIRMVVTGNGKLMGSVVPNTSVKELEIAVVGEGPLKKIDVFRNGDFFRRLYPEGLTFLQTVRIEEDEPSNWYVRATQLDNHVATSSPIWFEG